MNPLNPFTEEQLDFLHAVRESFSEGFAKLVAKHLDECRSLEEVGELQMMIQDATSVYGCNWGKHSTKFRPATFAEVTRKMKHSKL